MTSSTIFEIAGKVVPLTPSAAIQITKSYADVQDIGESSGTRSFTFRIVNTPEAKEVFKDYWNVNAGQDTFDPRVKVPALLRSGGLASIVGHVQLLKVVHDNHRIAEYEVIFYGEAPTLRKDIGDKFMEDLDYTALDHTLDTATFADLITQGFAGGDLVYALMDKGQNFSNAGGPGTLPTNGGTSNPIHYADFTPCIRRRWLVRKIVEEAGFAFTSAFLDDSDMDNVYDAFIGDRYTLSTVKGEAQVGSLYRQTALVFNNPTGLNVINGMTEDFDPSNNFSTGATFTAPYSGNFTFRYWVTTQASVVGGGQAIFALTRNGVAVVGSATLLDYTFLAFNFNISKEVEVTLSAGDTVQFVVAFIYTGTATFTLQGTNPSDQLTGTGLSCIFASPPFHSQPIDLNANAPDIKQSDYLRGVMRRYNMALIPDPNHPKGVILEPITEIIYTGATRDWTSKIDPDKDVVDMPTTAMQNRNLTLTYDRGTDIINRLTFDAINETYGIQKIDNTGNDFAVSDKVIKTDHVFAIPCNAIAATDIVIHKSINDKGEAVLRACKGGYWASIATATQLLVWNPSTSSMDTLTSYPYLGHYEEPFADDSMNDENFGVATPWHLVASGTNRTLFERFWRPYLSEVYSPLARMRTVYVDLTPLEFYELDFRDAIFIKDSYWRVNRVVDYNMTSPENVQIELIKQVTTPRPCFWVPTGNTGPLIVFQDPDGNTGVGSEECCKLYGGFWFTEGSGFCIRTNQNANTTTDGDKVITLGDAQDAAAAGSDSFVSEPGGSTFLGTVKSSLIVGDGHTIGSEADGKKGLVVSGVGAQVGIEHRAHGVCNKSQYGKMFICQNEDTTGPGSFILKNPEGQSNIGLGQNQTIAGKIFVTLQGSIGEYISADFILNRYTNTWGNDIVNTLSTSNADYQLALVYAGDSLEFELSFAVGDGPGTQVGGWIEFTRIYP